jgi:hypothetical protein
MSVETMLTQIGEPFYIRKKGPRVKHAVFQCSCGRSDIFFVGNVLSGQTKSCGCLVKTTMAAIQTTHGKSASMEYGSWKKLLVRVRGTNGEMSQKHYCGRGISVCDRWLKFENFLADMGPRPSLQHSIERIDVNGNYAPENCKWATQREQCRNRRSNSIIEVDGLSLCVAEWAEKCGIKATTITMRLRGGWSASDAVKTPVKHRSIKES